MVTWECEKHLSCIFKHNLPLTDYLIFFFLSFLLYFLTQKVPKRPSLSTTFACAGRFGSLDKILALVAKRSVGMTIAQ